MTSSGGTVCPTCRPPPARTGSRCRYLFPSRRLSCRSWCRGSPAADRSWPTPPHWLPETVEM
ncbi:hypothetical protein FJT64_012698 [Amphibalanus amphitrite]|uniref:Uncharacterized protein n=1 Tax=Amphibalanus amphitrite TaxID=1232801 RepID=A0A6A4VHL7_AMPAM|nr:hypothetical protein FJT64_012698 [Amphibalanus amphitrite]